MRHMSIVKPCPPKWKFEPAAKLSCSNPFKDLLIKIQLSKAVFVKGLKNFESLNKGPVWDIPLSKRDFFV